MFKLRVSASAILLAIALAACSNNDSSTGPGSDKTAPAQVTDLAVVASGDSTLTLQWTAPGDDGNTGKAQSYQVRWSHTAITGSNFGSATPVASPPAPATAGTVQQFVVTGLDTTLVTHFALRARDDAGNYSAVSNDAAWTPVGSDVTPPAKITDLAVIGAGNNSVTIQWTAPGDDGNTGTASSYEVRWSLAAITGANFASATLAPGAPAPAVAGTVQQFTVTGLDTTLVTHFAMIARDEVPNSSPVSNDAVWTPHTGQHLVKNIPPFKDNTMYQEDGTVSNALGPYIFTGRTVGNSGTENRRALLAFAVSDSIPAGAVIDSVKLTLHLSKRRDNTSRATSLHRLTADWGEGTSNAGDPGGAGISATTNDATWVYRFFNTTMWTTAGGDFVAGASATTSVTGLGFYTWKSALMKSDVQGWLDTPASNFGWIVIGVESALGTAKRFDSRENPTPANRPVLKVFYTVP